MFWFGAFICLALIGLLTAAMRANEMFMVSVRKGRTLLMRGRIPPSLHAEIKDVVARAQVAHATLRVVRSGGAPRLLASGVEPEVAQRLRNVLGLVTDVQLRAAPRPIRRNLGQVLGIAWLAFRLTG